MSTKVEALSLGCQILRAFCSKFSAARPRMIQLAIRSRHQRTTAPVTPAGGSHSFERPEAGCCGCGSSFRTQPRSMRCGFAAHTRLTKRWVKRGKLLAAN